MTNKEKWTVGLVGTLVIITMCCVGSLLLLNIGSTLYQSVDFPTYTPSSTPRPTEEAAPTAKPWKGDLFDHKEYTFPGIAPEHSIAELYDQTTGFCASVKVNSNEQLVWAGSGAYWTALISGGQDAVDDRWSHHVDEYLTKSKTADCKVYNSVEMFLSTNPTYK